MSQHIFSTLHETLPVTVMLGWDRPIGHFFMVIERVDVDSDDFVYSNLDEVEPFDKELSFYKAKLKDLGIQVPQCMFPQLEMDKKRGIGNRTVTYFVDGTFEELGDGV
jgi:hypothetical protein